MSDHCPICQSPIIGTPASCPICGFRLQERTQRFAPVTLEGEERARTPTSQHAVLRMVRGPQIGITYPLESDTITLGRNPESTIFLNDMTVSREHARIDHEGEAFIIKDLQSYNGLWVNNRNVEAHALEDGDFVQIGKFGFIFDAS